MRVLDITDPAKAVEVYSKGGVWNKDGSSEEFDSAAVTRRWRYHHRLERGIAEEHRRGLL